jgi:hypothetical protein
VIAGLGGVCWLFENSTGCLLSQCQLIYTPWRGLDDRVWDSFGDNMFVAGFDPPTDLGFVGEFDPGSGRTLAACLTHASRAERPFGVLERRTGE